MSDVMLKVENVSKIYRLGTLGTGTFGGDVQRFWKTKILGQEDPFLKVGQINDRTSKEKADFVWALQNINFEVKRGEVLGIIGKNGAGKSTLLKLLSRITSPTTGIIKSAGRMASLLEVGTGFHPELTGRENIFLNGAILGMTKKEIQSKFDEIVDFSGCKLYIDTPTKRYSSGMTVRLGFAVAAFLDPDILVVDEVLAVGDLEFQEKAIGKMQDVSRSEGKTVLFVSHNMGSIRDLCNKTIVIDKGLVSFDGITENAIEFYYKNSNLRYNKKNTLLIEGNLNKNFKINEISINDIILENEWIIINPTEEIQIIFKLEHNIQHLEIIYSLVIFCNGQRITTIEDSDTFTKSFKNNEIIFRIKANLLRPSIYSIGFGGRTKRDDYFWCKEIMSFEVSELWTKHNKRERAGIINLDESLYFTQRL